MVRDTSKDVNFAVINGERTYIGPDRRAERRRTHNSERIERLLRNFGLDRRASTERRRTDTSWLLTSKKVVNQQSVAFHRISKHNQRPVHQVVLLMRLLKFHHIYSDISPSVVQSIDCPGANQQGICLQVKRDDQLHPVISGNKWRKLKHLLLKIESQGYRRITAMGGPYSNLLHSLAYICHRLGWQFQMLVRAYPEQPLTPMLRDAKRWGAKIVYLDKKAFRQLRSEPPQLDEGEFWINEGGFHPDSFKGTQETFMEFAQLPDYLVMATATGASLMGLALGAHRQSKPIKIIGISVLNNAQQVAADLDRLLPEQVKRPELIQGYEFGGYAKSNQELDRFISGFEKEHAIALEKVYSGKSFYAVMDLIEKGYFAMGSRVCVIHCGGMQGKRNSTGVDLKEKRLTES